MLAGDQLDRAYAKLKSDEQQRGDRRVHPTHRARWIWGRYWLRFALSRYVDSDASELEFAYGEGGKPYLPGSSLHFSLSHSENYWALALAPFELGLDIEMIRARKRIRGLVERFFAEPEIRAFGAASPDQAQAWFYRQWSRKEAYQKAVGAGLRASLADFAVLSEPGETQGLMVQAQREDFGYKVEPWRVHDLAIFDACSAALCLPRGGQISRAFDLGQHFEGGEDA